MTGIAVGKKKFMQHDEGFQLNSAVSDAATSNLRSEIRVGDRPSPLSNKISLEGSILHFLPFGFVVIWAIALVWCGQRRSRYLISSGGDRSQQCCRNCLFFKDNPYLKCAVNPTDALTKQAIDCSDYSPQAHPFQKRRATPKR